MSTCNCKNSLLITFNAYYNQVELKRCCWSEPIVVKSIKDFLKIKDIFNYGISIKNTPKHNSEGCHGDCSQVSEFIDTVQVAILRNCNLNCYHCIAGTNHHLDTALMRKIDEFCLKNLKGHHIKLLKLTNVGEILVYYNNLIKYLISIDKNDFENIEILTNGTLLDDERLSTLKDISNLTNENYIFRYSIDAISESTYKKTRVGGDFNKVLHNIEKTIELFGLDNIFISFTIKKSNRDEALLFHQFYKEKFKINDKHLYLGYDLTTQDPNDILIYNQALKKLNN